MFIRWNAILPQLSVTPSSVKFSNRAFALSPLRLGSGAAPILVNSRKGSSIQQSANTRFFDLPSFPKKRSIFRAHPRARARVLPQGSGANLAKYIHAPGPEINYLINSAPGEEGEGRKEWCAGDSIQRAAAPRRTRRRREREKERERRVCGKWVICIPDSAAAQK